MPFHPLLEKSNFVNYSMLPTVALKEIGKYIISNPADEIKKVASRSISSWRKKYSYGLKDSLKIMEGKLEKHISVNISSLKLNGVQKVLDRLNHFKRSINRYRNPRFAKSKKSQNILKAYCLIRSKHTYRQLINKHANLEVLLSETNMRLNDIHLIREKLNSMENSELSHYIMFIKKLQSIIYMNDKKTRSLNIISLFNDKKYKFSVPINITYKGREISEYDITKDYLIKLVKKLSRENDIKQPKYLARKKKHELIECIEEMVAGCYYLNIGKIEEGRWARYYGVHSLNRVTNCDDNIYISFYYNGFENSYYIDNTNIMFIERLAKTGYSSDTVYSINDECKKMLS